jgi:tetratricopeptide (TPR) repeat protein
LSGGEFLSEGEVPLKRCHLAIIICLTILSLVACGKSLLPIQPLWKPHDMIMRLKKSVVTVIAFDMDGNILRIGSGFFVNQDGALVTDYHVLNGAYQAKIKTSDGDVYPVISVIAHNMLIDLIKVRVQIPCKNAVPVILANREPKVMDRVMVIGTPMGLEQTVSEGIVSAVRKHPTYGNLYQLTAPISQGSSGGPAMNLKGEVFGVVSYQAADGQNLNFAISTRIFPTLFLEAGEPDLVRWTIENAGHDPSLAASMCQRGVQISIKGRQQAALAFFQQAAESNPDDLNSWTGLGSCYVGLGQPDSAIKAFNQAIAVAPDNTIGHFMLAMFYKTLKQYSDEVQPLLKVIDIDPEHVLARLELAEAYGKLKQSDAQLDMFREILELNPDHVPTLHRLGQTMSELGRYDESLHFLEKASTLEPENAKIHFDMGVAYHNKKMPEEEMQAYKRAIQANLSLVQAHFNLGMLFLRHGNHRLALQEYAILKGLDKIEAERLFKNIYPVCLDEIIAP